MRAHVTVKPVRLGEAVVTCHHCGRREDVAESSEAVFNKRIADVAKLHAKCKHRREHGGGCPCMIAREKTADKKARKKEREHAQTTIDVGEG